MASVRDTLLAMLTQYPSIFPDKTACYRHLFLVNGNGYEWVDGELVAVCESKSEPDFKNEDEEIERRNGGDHYRSDFMDNSIRLDVRRNNMLIQFAMDNIDLIVEDRLEFHSGIRFHYSGWAYSRLMQVPDDVKPDWRAAVLECMRALTVHINGIKKWGVMYDACTEKLDRDLTRLKEQKFPEVIQNEEEMKKVVQEILSEVKNDG